MTRFSGTTPVEKSVLEYEAKFKQDRYEKWKLLKKLKQVYEDQYTGYYEPSDSGYKDSFDKWVLNTCGMEIFFDQSGYISGRIDIVDEAKYAWCLLKYK